MANIKHILVLLLVATTSLLQAQLIGHAANVYEEKNAPLSDDDRIHKHVDLVPLFGDCYKPKTFTLEQQFCSHEKIKAFIKNNLQYPAAAKAAGVSGKVTVWAVIEMDGSVSEVRIRESDAKQLEEEAVRLVKSMPKWQPAKLKEKTVRAFHEMIIDFQLSE